MMGDPCQALRRRIKVKLNSHLRCDQLGPLTTNSLQERDQRRCFTFISLHFLVSPPLRLFIFEPPGVQHDGASVRPGHPLPLLRCQRPRLHPRPERPRAKGLFFFVCDLRRHSDFPSSKPTNTGWTFRRIPLEAPLFCR